MKKKGLIGIIVLLLLLILFSCSNNEGAHEDPSSQREDHHPEGKKETNTTEISVSAIGDILIHDSIYEDAKTKQGYDFTPMFEQVEPYLSDATITMANQETMIGGEKLGISSYPRFNSPHEVGDALKRAGVDVVTLANNHTLDSGEEGIKRAIRHWKKLDMTYTGAFESKKDQENIRVVQTEEGIDVSFLSYTYGTNGIPVPEGKDYLVNFIDKPTMKEDIEEAKRKSDAVILSLHVGNQYETFPNHNQKELAQFAADQGVHAVIGHHSHTLQPVEWVKGKNGNKTLVVYSLGNFIAAHDKNVLDRKIGGVLRFNIEKKTTDAGDSFHVQEPEFLPTYVDDTNKNDYRVMPMYQVSNKDLADAKTLYRETKQHMRRWMPELEFIEEE